MQKLIMRWFHRAAAILFNPHACSSTRGTEVVSSPHTTRDISEMVTQTIEIIVEGPEMTA